jgi:hypothetical protein
MARLNLLPRGLLLAALLFSPCSVAQSDGDEADGGGTSVASHERSVPSGPYATYTSTLRASALDTDGVSTGTNTATARTVSGDDDDDNTATASSINSTDVSGGLVTTTPLTDLVGTRTIPTTTFLSNETASSTGDVAASTPVATNSQPCNQHVEFCQRKYSNITFISAHNSPFVREGNVAANQRYGPTDQLNDGVRLLQGQMHIKDGVPHMCHSSCDMLDTGPMSDWLATIKDWVDGHRFDVVTILIGNADPYPDPSTWVSFIEDTGILEYAYAAPQMPMALSDWPTLAEMILLNKRVVIMVDYKADYTKWPWMLDEFGVMWETPFDPVDRSFPCTVERPPDLSEDDARKNRMMLMNHNFNVEFNILDTSILTPALSLLNETNAVSGYGSLGLAAEQCRAKWGRPPNFLNVDYYDEGSSPGSVFEVAAAMNGVEYTGTCCGTTGAAPPGVVIPAGWTLFWACALSVVFTLFMV